MPARPLSHRVALSFALLAAIAIGAPACGSGSSGGAGPDGAGQSLVLSNFFQAGQDNVPINRILRFDFSEPVSRASIGAGSIQIREGDAYGLTATGEFVVDGATVFFEPQLPTSCGVADAGLQPNTTYRVTVMGSPEEFSVKNTQGQPLQETVTYEFSTRFEGDPEVLEDQIPATPPAVTSISPGNSEAAVTVDGDNEIVVGFTENLDPCTISADSVRFYVYQIGVLGVHNEVPAGDPPGNPNAGNTTGFTPYDDQSEDDPYSWGTSGTTLTDPQRIPASFELVQNFDTTELRIVPEFGVFPENSLCVVDLTFRVLDFGGSPLSPVTFSFTTENLDEQEGVMRIEFDTESEDWPDVDRTADVNSTRSPGLVQGWLLFAGDGDNGGNTTITPSFPITTPGFVCDKRPNDGSKDRFEPSNNVTLDTGSSRVPDTCSNPTDQSQAVIYEFDIFHIKPNVTVTVAGVNPAIFLVRGEVLIEAGGVLRARGGQGEAGTAYGSLPSSTPIPVSDGGTGVAGGGDGGDGANKGKNYGSDGFAGYGSPAYGTAAEQGGHGAGQGNFSATGTSYYNTSGNGNSGAGGGGGHGVVGGDGDSFVKATLTPLAPARGAGGGVYPGGSTAAELYTPSAGSGGGGAGWAGHGTTSSNYYYYVAAGGAGGAGGGFIDITSQSDITIYGVIDASGGRGGRGGDGGYWSAGGGGGGSGGGIRLLTPSSIDLEGSFLSTAGGVGGIGVKARNNASETLPNHGGAGGSGWIALEDGDSIITGANTAVLTPAFGTPQCYVGTFNSGRFSGGGSVVAFATSGPMQVGPLSPVEFYLPDEDDFLCAIPSDAAILPDGTGILIEAAGYPMKPDGTVDDSGGDAWYTVGYFWYSGAPNEPNWTEGSNPPDVPVINAGQGIDMLNGSAFLRFRIRLFMPAGFGATTPGPWMDWMQFRFKYDQ